MVASMSSVYKPSDDTVARKNQDGTVVVMKMDDSNIFFKIDGVASEVWKLILDGLTPQEIKAKILNEFNCTEDQVNEDVTKFMQELLDRNLIELKA
jgi:hypothetical protein